MNRLSPVRLPPADSYPFGVQRQNHLWPAGPDGDGGAEQITLKQAIHCLEGDPQASNATPPSSPEQQVVAQLADQLEQQRLHRLRSTSLAQLLERRDGLIQAQTMYFI